MTPAPPRPAAQRKADTLAKLAESGADVWVASASTDDGGAPQAHLVPLSLAWIDERVVVAVEPDSRTARNVIDRGNARLALGPTRDVVIIDAVLDEAIDVDDAPPEFAQRYVDQADWDPRSAGPNVFLVLRPRRIQAWRESNELAGRTLMRAGSWVV
jgi:hypothetical protein